ncbi:VOC family protein [Ramlibacter rhizophilus]|uniref:4-hydroxyphenylpyruvate dioxygenase n=1 Tax=Ramlibacter rhizophilus TaxID=1781167 RepID=A0A4Z0BM46_9BURK|nr:VOC family protein [Ramlibacter rhizophilus]TFY99880.1 4-hydroxyphenylpyruvate dioxygenase [Ramlibacter rhizophilus]
MTSNREAVPELPNPLGLEGIEFIEYATLRPQALGQVLEMMGFRPVARHRSREVTLYRQGGLNLVVNAHPDDARASATEGGHPVLSAVAFRVRDARLAHARCLDLGAWDTPGHAQAMELNIPGIQGPGASHFFFVDRWRDFSIYDIDFTPIPTVDPHPPAIAGERWFGVVQYIASGRSAEWMAFYEQLFGFGDIPDDQRFGVMPAGKLMRSPCGSFMWQLIEPASPDADDGRESLQRVGIGAADVPAAVAQLRGRGVQFVDSTQLHPDDRGALTVTQLGSVAFELVHITT